MTINYLAPNRCHFYTDDTPPAPPRVDDDLYGLGLSIWQLFTRQFPFEEWYEDDIVEVLRDGGTVDVGLVHEPHVREIIKNYLRRGGARL